MQHHEQFDSGERLIRLASVMIAAGAICAMVLANVPAGPYAEIWQRTFSVALGPSYASATLAWWITSVLLPVICFVAVLELRRLGARVREERSRRPAFAILATWVVLLVALAAERSGPPAGGDNAVNVTLSLFLLLCFNRARVPFLWPYIACACVLLWFGRSIHVVIHGAVLGLALPVISLRGESPFINTIELALRRLETAFERSRPEDWDESIAMVADAAEAELSPTRRAQRWVAPVVAGVILPVMVLANAGARVSELAAGGRADLIMASVGGAMLLVTAVRFAAERLAGQATRVALAATAIAFAMGVCLTALIFEDDVRAATAMLGLWTGTLLGTCVAHLILVFLRRRSSSRARPIVVLQFPGSR